MLRRCGAIFCDMPISPFEHQIRQLAATSFLDLVSAIYDLRRIDMEQHVRDALDDIMYREEARRSSEEQTRPPLKWIPQMGTYGR
jgi:hypothetical protein